MENCFDPGNTPKTQDPIILHKLVDQLMQSLLPRAIQQRNLIVNDVQHEMLVSADKNMLASVLGSLLYDTVAHASNNCIRITAKSYGRITLIHVRNSENRDDRSIVSNLHQIQPLAEKLGGCVSVTNNRINGTTVAFTFLNLPAAA